MAKRYELPDAAWELFKDLVSPEQRMGRPRSDDRLVLNGIFWILCSGAAWRDLPERFGPWSTVYQRFRDWRDEGTFDRVLERLHVRLNQEGLIDLDTWMIDSTAVRAARASSGAGKRGAGRTARPCVGAQPRRPDHQDPPDLRCQWDTSSLPAVTRAGQRHCPCSAALGSGAYPRQVGAASQTLSLVTGRQGLRRRASAPVLRPLPHAAGDSATHHEAQAQARVAPAV